MVATMKLAAPGAPYLMVFVAGKPVSVNMMYAKGGGRNKYGKHLCNDAVAWEQTVWYEVVHSSTRRRPQLKQPLRIPLRIEIDLYRLRANADPDNYLKCTLDGIKHALRIDDRHFGDVRVRRAAATPDKRRGALITIWEAGGES
jgi:Holliday junction resolvase RusA-like endonuclease